MSAAIPPHIPARLVVDFDFANLPGAERDVHLAWKRLHDGPDLFWTPHYGGHWIATRAELIETIQTDHQRFSHREFTLPRGYKQLTVPPLEFDPPEHTEYRRIISPAFAPAVIARLEEGIRELAVTLIEEIKPRGHCDLVHDFAQQLPVTVFLRMVDLPLGDREMFLEWAEVIVHSADKEAKGAAFRKAIGYLSDVIAQRRAHPADDLLSRIIQSKVGDRTINAEEVLGMCVLLFFGGLDTVASMISFVAWFLARNPGHRRQLIENPALMQLAMEELFRRHGLSNTIRLIVQDTELGGVQLKKDEVVMVPISLHGLDDRRFPNPLEVDFSRRPVHAAFGNGPHRCPGATLARKEVGIFLEEWLKRIPDFHVTPGMEVRTTSGSVNGVVSLPLSW
jgi:cytochrome P450